MPTRWGELFPWPLVGVSVLLAMLIVLTPNLLSVGSSPSAGSLETQAILVVDRLPGASTTQLYVHGLGTVRYQSISIAWANGTASGVAPHARWHNGTVGTTAISVNTTVAANPFVANVTAEYIDSAGAVVWYIGTYVFDATGGTLYVTSLLAGSATVSPTPIPQLPLSLLLTASPTESGT